MTTIAYKDGVIETQSKQVLGHLPAILCDHWIGPPARCENVSALLSRTTKTPRSFSTPGFFGCVKFSRYLFVLPHAGGRGDDETSLVCDVVNVRQKRDVPVVTYLRGTAVSVLGDDLRRYRVYAELKPAIPSTFQGGIPFRRRQSCLNLARL